MNHRASTFVIFLLIALFLRTAPAQAAVRCEDLARLSLPATTVTLAQRVAAGGFALPGGTGRNAAAQHLFVKRPAFCRVSLTAKPAKDSDVRIEVWLPESGWNGKFQAVGEGGLAGFIPYALMAPALAEGYATCGGGPGPDTFDKMAAITKWIEQGQKPARNLP